MTTPDVIRRLAFVKQLLRLAEQRLHGSDAIAATAILSFHDAVELWLRLAAEHVDADVKAKSDFMYYWEVLAKKLGQALPQKAAMERLNKVRVNLKHYGVLPTRGEVESLRHAVETFMLEATQQAFQLSLSEIGLIDLLPESEVKALVGSAQENLKAGQTREAIDDVAKALYALSACFDDRTIMVPGRESVRVVSRFAFDMGYRFNRETSQAFEHLDGRVRDLRLRLTMLELGVDVQRYRRVLVFLPHVQCSSAGALHIVRTGGAPALEANVAEAQECIDFVVDTAIDLVQYWHGERPGAQGDDSGGA